MVLYLSLICFNLFVHGRRIALLSFVECRYKSVMNMHQVRHIISCLCFLFWQVIIVSRATGTFELLSSILFVESDIYSYIF